MKEKCKGTKKNGEPCTAWAMANGYCRRHGGKVVADQETSEVEEKEESVAIGETPVETETCGATTGKGTPCKLRVVENGRCRKHQRIPDIVEETVAEPEEEVAESPEIEAAAEATEVQEKKPASKRRKRKKRKRKPKECGALTAKGTPCTFKVSANGRCGKHQGVPDAPSEAFLNEEKVAAPKISPEKEEKTGTLKYSAYISSLIDEGEEEVFNEFFSLFYKDFTLNSSSDRMNCEIACIYYAKLLQAIKNNDIETASKLDQLLKNKLADLKADK